MTKEILKDEIMSEEELEKVAGGTIDETNNLSEVLGVNADEVVNGNTGLIEDKLAKIGISADFICTVNHIRIYPGMQPKDTTNRFHDANGKEYNNAEVVKLVQKYQADGFKF